jgi:hypothetical protein
VPFISVRVTWVTVATSERIQRSVRLNIERSYSIISKNSCRLCRSWWGGHPGFASKDETLERTILQVSQKIMQKKS